MGVGERTSIRTDTTEIRAEVARLRCCISMAMGCISPLSRNVDERLAWYRLLDAMEGREPRASISAIRRGKSWSKP